MTEVGIQEAEAKLCQLVERAQAGEDIVITQDGKPAVRLVPVVPRPFAEARGIWRGRVHIADDFDELPDDIADAFGAR
jgi:prevent-host-death family protein